jgi:hypothetical protein
VALFSLLKKCKITIIGTVKKYLKVAYNEKARGFGKIVE